MIQSRMLFHLMAILAFAAMFALVGCDDSSTDPGDPADALVGSWVLTNVTRYYDSSEQVYEGDFDPYYDSTGQVINLVYTFNSDGTGSMVVNYTTDFTYTATADEISFIITDDDFVLAYELSGNTLIFTAQMFNAEAQILGSLVMTFTKQ